jgi:uncharacterized protein with von Willebrand factor type A (vWA) domain
MSVSDRVSKVLSAVGLSGGPLPANVIEENTMIIEVAREAKAFNLIGGQETSTVFVEIKQWMSLSQSLVVEDFEKIDRYLVMKSYLVNGFTVADAALFVAISSSTFRASVLSYNELKRW